MSTPPGSYWIRCNIPSSISSHDLHRIKYLAELAPKKEIGGVITINGDELIEIENVCTEPSAGYIPCSRQYINIAVDEGIKCIWHTHVNNTDTFSPQDINQIWGDDVPWLLYCLQPNIFKYKDPKVIEPYIGRSWEQSWTDCYGLVRDFYRQELSIQLPVPYHTGDHCPWLDKEWNGMLCKLPEHFDPISNHSDVKPCDVVVYKGLRGLNPSHMGLILNTRSGYQLLHHEYKRRSELTTTVEPDKIHSIWRSKCTISQSNYSDLWALDMGGCTSSRPIELVRL